MFYTIYKTTNFLNGRTYIGKHQTRDLDDDYLGSGKLLKRAIKKHGKENFKKEILHLMDSSESMNRMEALLVTEEFCQSDDNYNLCSGGKGGWSYVNRNYDKELRKKNAVLGGSIIRQKLLSYSEEEKIKESELRSKKLKLSWLEGKRSIASNFKWNGKHSEETKKHISEKNKGIKKGQSNSQFGTMWITNNVSDRKIQKNTQVPDGWHKGRKKLYINTTNANI